MKKIGNVTLDTSCYSGKDLYSDGWIEDRILELAENYPPEEYNRVIAQEQDWAVMYHLAHERENILSWYPFETGAKVLEIGSGCGAVTGAAAAGADSVTCIDLSLKRSTINGLRNQCRDSVRICVGNFQDIEKGLEHDFDYATLIGVFEYGRGYIGGEKPYHGFLRTIMNHLKPGGRLLIAIENKFGLKYWAGCREDHVGTFFEGLEGYQNTEGVRTFTRPELVEMLEECGYRNYRFYYPYPDYKFPTVIYSDEYLPRPGELDKNICNFDRDRLVLMDEGKVFDQILKDGLFPLYANSFFLEITKDPEEGKGLESEGKLEIRKEPRGEITEEFKKIADQKRIVYTKYSSGRSPKFAIRTCIARENEEFLLYKTPEYPAGALHIQSIAGAKEKLEKLWEEKKLYQVNQCWLEGEKIFFEYLKGVTLEEKLDQLLEEGKQNSVKELLRVEVRNILEAAPTGTFSMTPEFQKVFGNVTFSQEETAVEPADIDLIFSNILLTEDGKRHVLDYEWTFDFPVPAGYLAYRALHYYLDAASKRKILKEDLNLYEEFGITADKILKYEEMERNFQQYIRGNYVPVGELYHRMGKKALPLGEVLKEKDRRRMQVYVDFGEGFCEEHSWFVDHGYDSVIQCTVSIPEQARAVWIDPALAPCILKDLSLRWSGEGQREPIPVTYTTTGYEMKKNCYVFDNSDPKIIIEEIPEGKRQIDISYRISILEEETAVLLMDRVNTKGRMKKKVRGLLEG